MITVPAALIAALIAIESSGNDFAVGDHGKAVGCLQIHPEVVQDVSRRVRPYTLAQRLDRKASIEICVFYLNLYANVMRLGHAPSNEDLARIWHGGPNGYKDRRTLPYWEKVRVQMLKDLGSPPVIRPADLDGVKLDSPKP